MWQEMEKVEAGLEQRVWNRVQAQQVPALQALAAAEVAMAAAYRLLERMTQGQVRQKLRLLAERELAHGQCLKGMHRMRTGQPLQLRSAPPEIARPEIALRKCYGRTLQALAAYRQMESDGEYGCVFRDLAREEEAHCRWLLEIFDAAAGKA